MKAYFHQDWPLDECQKLCLLLTEVDQHCLFLHVQKYPVFIFPKYREHRIILKVPLWYIQSKLTLFISGKDLFVQSGMAPALNFLYCTCHKPTELMLLGNVWENEWPKWKQCTLLDRLSNFFSAFDPSEWCFELLKRRNAWAKGLIFNSKLYVVVGENEKRHGGAGDDGVGIGLSL